MSWDLTDRSTRLRVISSAILILGLLGAIVIYWNAVPPPENPLVDQLENSKQYQHQLEIYGGQSNVLASDFRQWFVGLWHGRSLAVTVAFIALLLAAGFRVAAIPLPPLDDGDPGSGGPGTGGDGKP
jgi:hypothetical protein